MISRQRGTAAASSGECLASYDKASPMISNCLSTAERTKSFDWYEAKSCPSRNLDTRFEACWMSHSQARGSRGIDELSAGIDTRKHIGVTYATGYQQIDRPVQDHFQLCFEPEVLVQRVGTCFIELHQQIDITAQRIKAACGCRAKNFQAAHTEPAADNRHLFAARIDVDMHVGEFNGPARTSPSPVRARSGRAPMPWRQVIATA